MQHRLVGLLLLCALLLVVLPATVRSNSHDSDPPQVSIVGGQAVPSPNPYVWQVALSTLPADDSNSQFCGGALIAADWVLTAAHCFFDAQGTQTDPSTFGVVIDRPDLDDTSVGSVINVAQLIIHEAYDLNTKVNDIALIRLANPVLTTANVIPLMTLGQEATLGAPGVQATVSGWGGLLGYSPEQKEPEGGQQYPNVLQYVELPLIDNATCNDAIGGVLDSMLCAGVPEGGIDSCQGDSGGPLVVPNGAGGYLLSGVVSTGPGCAAPDTYGIYTRVSAYNGWIMARLVDPATLTPQAYLPLID